MQHFPHGNQFSKFQQLCMSFFDTFNILKARKLLEKILKVIKNDVKYQK